MTPELILAIAAPVLAGLTVVASAFFGRHSGRAAVQQAVTDERRAATADWAAYSAELRQHTKQLSERLSTVERRLDETEKQAQTSEYLLRIALRHIRDLVAWGVGPRTEPMPEPPTELLDQL